MNAQPPISRRRVDVKSEAKSSWVENVMGVPSWERRGRLLRGGRSPGRGRMDRREVVRRSGSEEWGGVRDSVAGSAVKGFGGSMSGGGSGAAGDFRRSRGYSSGGW